MVGLSLLLGICGGSWETLQLLSMRVETRSETVDALDQRIEEALQALE